MTYNVMICDRDDCDGTKFAIHGVLPKKKDKEGMTYFQLICFKCGYGGLFKGVNISKGVIIHDMEAYLDVVDDE